MTYGRDKVIGGTALVVLNYNDSETTGAFLERSKHIKSIDNVIIVDNRSTDGSQEALLLYCDEKTHLIEAEENAGYAAGNNLGARYAIDELHSEFLFIANPDTRFGDDAIEAIRNCLETVNDVGAVTCRMKTRASFPTMSGWKLPSYHECLRDAVPGLDKLLGRADHVKMFVHGTCDDPIPVGAVAGSFFGVRSDCFESIDGFDERTFLYYEENILGMRLKKAGKQSYVLPYVSYLHDHQVSVCKSLPDKKIRFEIAQASREVYCRNYLETSRSCILLLKCVFGISLRLYLSLAWIRSRLELNRRG